MATNSSTKKVVSKKLLKIVNTKVQTSVIIDEQIGLENVLNVTCQPSIVSNDMLGEFVQVCGKIAYQICYLSNIKTYEVVEEVVELNERLQLGSFENVYVIPKVKNIQFKKAGTNLIDAVANIELEIYGVMIDEISPINTGNENCVEKTNVINTQILSANTSEKFDIIEEFEVADNVDKILVSSCKLTNIRTVPNDNYAKIEGAIDLELTYVSHDTIKQLKKSLDFTQEVAVLNLKSSDIIDDSIYIDSFNMSANVVENQNKSILNISCTLMTNVFAYNQEETTVVVDLFSTHKQLTFSTECFSNTKFLKKTSSTEHVKVSVDMKENKRMDEIVFIGVPLLNVVNSVVETDSIGFTGTVYQNIVFKNYDTEEVGQIKLEIPVATNLLLHDIATDSEIEYSIKVINYKNKAGKEIDINYELEFAVKNNSMSYDCFVSNVEEIADIVKNDNSIIVYLPRQDDDLYSIAKELKVSPDVILSQNPNFDELTENKKIVIYLQKK